MTPEFEKHVSMVFAWLQARPVTPKSIVLDGPEAIAIASATGMRSENQDRVALVRVSNQASIGANVQAAVLLDGIGGMADGASAASLALASFSIYLAFGDCARGLKSLIMEAAEFANDVVYQRYRARGGTTLTAVLFGRQGAVGLSVGDSRAYICSKAGLRQLSEDDTLSGHLGNASKKLDPWRFPDSIDNRLSQFVGMGEGIQPHLIALPAYDSAESEATLLLMTDGAYFVGQQILEVLLRQKSDPSELAQRILTMAEWLGGNDNASIAVVPARPQFIEERSDSSATRLSLSARGDTFALVASGKIEWGKSNEHDQEGAPPSKQLEVTPRVREQTPYNAAKAKINYQPATTRKKSHRKSGRTKQKQQNESLLLELVSDKK